MLPPKVTRNSCQLGSERWTSPREEIPWPLVALVRKTLTMTPILGLLPHALHCTHTAGKAWHLSPVQRGKRSPWGSLPPSGMWLRKAENSMGSPVYSVPCISPMAHPPNSMHDPRLASCHPTLWLEGIAFQEHMWRKVDQTGPPLRGGARRTWHPECRVLLVYSQLDKEFFKMSQQTTL